MRYDDETTRRPISRRAPSDPTSVPVLTLLTHPDPKRIGERAHLPELDLGMVVELSRAAPRFSRSGALWDDRPLGDPFLSRKAWRLRLEDEGLRLDRGSSSTTLHCDGTSLPEGGMLAPELLERGVVLELGDRVALLLHRRPSAPAPSETADGMVGGSAALDTVRQAVARVAPLDVSVLLLGESGTGKELVARALHRAGSRHERPFVAVDLGALTPSLAASELFGHRRGAFTGAAESRTGYFQAAKGGTLFLDEVAEAPGEVQSLLLRALETREITAVGSHERQQIDVRVVSATDADLEARVREGTFKAPLFHRLAGYQIHIPPLRQRREDLGLLVVALARPMLAELGSTDLLEVPSGNAPPWLPTQLISRLARASWPGNIRQLGNVVRQLVIDSPKGGPLAGLRLEEMLGETPPTALPGDGPSPATVDAVASPPVATVAPAPRKRRPADLEDQEIEEAMRACQFEPAAAARLLGIQRPSLYHLIERHPRLRLAHAVPDDELHAVLAECGDDLREAARRLEVSTRALRRRVNRGGETTRVLRFRRS